MPPNNVMPDVTGKYVVKNPGFADITVSGIPSSNTWYLNISAIKAYSSGGYGGAGTVGVITGGLGVNTIRTKVPELFSTWKVPCPYIADPL